MATRRIKDLITGEFIETQIVDIDEGENNAIILKLEDVTVLRLKIDIAQVVLAPNPDPLSDPIYRVQRSSSL